MKSRRLWAIWKSRLSNAVTVDSGERCIALAFTAALRLIRRRVSRMSEWNIYITDHGEDHEKKKVPRFVVRAKRIGDCLIVYGVGDTELVARQNAKDKMDVKDKAATT